MPRQFHHPPVSEITLDGILHALSDPIRRTIVKKLVNFDSLSCSQTCDVLPPSTLSFHYRVLRESGLVRSEKKGVEVINNLRRKDIEKRFPGLIKKIIESER